ncbi:protein transport protein Sec24C [Chrysoperla carnea]|uniref:protein transport protein Sec24C n=1 Tax=Chrysoperla carnea TaxID=189513 RepID=UPI001D08A3F2|nr:protein transport protein Sec24C [Chrysoperla carnea]
MNPQYMQPQQYGPPGGQNIPNPQGSYGPVQNKMAPPMANYNSNISQRPGIPPQNQLPNNPQQYAMARSPNQGISEPSPPVGPEPNNLPPLNQPEYPPQPPVQTNLQRPPPNSNFAPPSALPNPQTNPNQLAQQMAGLQVNPQMPPAQPGFTMNGDHHNQQRPPMQMPPGQLGPQGPGMLPPRAGGYPPQGNQPPHMQSQPPMTNLAGGMPPAPGQRGYPPSGQYVNGVQQRAQPGLPPQHAPQMAPPNPMNFHQPPHMPPMHPGQYPGNYPSQNEYSQPQQQKKLDPEHMPSPIQVMLEDQNTRSGVFCTNQKGLVPPLATTKFFTQDQGNCSPRYMRSTMYNIPITMDMMKQTSIPFGLVISPLARTVEQEYPPPIVNFGELGPVRCVRCKAYMCPFMQFIDSGRRFQCLFCKATTEVPNEYFQHLDHTGQRVDKYERPELVLGTYEFVATKDYCRNNVYPKPPAVVFVIDVSYNNVKSGLVHLLCAEMKNIIKNLPIDQGQEKSKMKVGFITYNKTVHFYNCKGNLAQPQMLVVGDVQEMFMPLLDGFLCDIEESEAVIDSLMEQIPIMFGDTRETETILYPAIQAGLEALKASECAGKLFVFHSSLPTSEAPGKLKNRDDRKLLGTDKERTVLTPQSNVYNNLGQECVAAGCSVDLFIFNNSYIDIATIGQVSRLTGGEVFKYTYFQADIDGPRLIQDLTTNISRPIAFDAIMRVRTSTGVRPTDFYGHFFMSNTTDMELASIDCNKGIALEIKHDDKLTEEEGVYIQTALLYTSCSGQRRLRIINLSLQTCSQYADLYRSCDLDTIMNFYGKQSTFRLLEHSPKAVKEGLVQRCAQTLACYRKHCAGPSNAGQLILPECMKLMPLYLNCLLKSDAISGGSDMTIDDRSYVMQSLMVMDVPSSVSFFYPRLTPVHDIDVNATDIPMPIRCTIERMVDNGAYILENGIHMFLWVGLNVNSEWVQSIFGVPSVIQANFDMVELPILENPLSNRMRNLIESIRSLRPHCMRLTLVRQGDKLEHVLKHFLAEDRGTDGSPSYVDFLCHLHKEIRVLLS